MNRKVFLSGLMSVLALAMFFVVSGLFAAPTQAQASDQHCACEVCCVGGTCCCETGDCSCEACECSCCAATAAQPAAPSAPESAECAVNGCATCCKTPAE